MNFAPLASAPALYLVAAFLSVNAGPNDRVIHSGEFVEYDTSNDLPRATGTGGHGGPGLIQLHVPDDDSAHVLLPGASSLADLSVPDVHILMLEPSL